MTRDEILAASRKLPTETRAAAAARWSIVHGEIVDRMPKGAKVFEVHHTVEAARLAFLTKLVAGSALDECRAAALAKAPRP